MSFEQAAYKVRRRTARDASGTRRSRIDDARGYIYLLRNDAFQDGWVKVGKTSRSGDERAKDLNREGGTGYPGRYRCMFEVETLDRHRAEVAVFGRLKPFRQGQQELFIVEMALAEQVIREECSRINHETLRQVDEANAKRARELKDQREAAERRSSSATPATNRPIPRTQPDHRIAPDGISRVQQAQSKTPARPSAGPRTSGQWVTPDQASAAWVAWRRAAQIQQASRDAALQLREKAPTAPAATNPHPEFRWILVLIAVLGFIAMTL